jgi:hypothetical protein
VEEASEGLCNLEEEALERRSQRRSKDGAKGTKRGEEKGGRLTRTIPN